jgi:hypothetical protein
MPQLRARKMAPAGPLQANRTNNHRVTIQEKTILPLTNYVEETERFHAERQATPARQSKSSRKHDQDRKHMLTLSSTS